MSDERAQQLARIGAVAAAAFGAVAVSSATRASAHMDRRLAPRLALRPRSRGRRVAEAASPAGKWYVVVPAAVIAGSLISRAARRPAAGGAIVASAILATLFGKAFDHMLPQPPAPANHRHEPQKAVFPSGHALVGTASALTAAYVISREALAGKWVTLPPAIAFAVLNPALKLAVRKHWLSDAAGGVVAGIAVSAGCCALYELGRD